MRWQYSCCCCHPTSNVDMNVLLMGEQFTQHSSHMQIFIHCLPDSRWPGEGVTPVTPSVAPHPQQQQPPLSHCQSTALTSPR